MQHVLLELVLLGMEDTQVGTGPTLRWGAENEQRPAYSLGGARVGGQHCVRRGLPLKSPAALQGSPPGPCPLAQPASSSTVPKVGVPTLTGQATPFPTPPLLFLLQLCFCSSSSSLKPTWLLTPQRYLQITISGGRWPDSSPSQALSAGSFHLPLSANPSSLLIIFSLPLKALQRANLAPCCSTLPVLHLRILQDNPMLLSPRVDQGQSGKGP